MKAICGRGRTLLRRSGALSAAVAVGALCVLALAGPASAAGAEGTVTFVPDNPADASASGHFAVWDGENVNLRNGTATSTSNSVLSGSDGSRIGVHEVFHMNVSASGIGGISFDKPVLTCG